MTASLKDTIATAIKTLKEETISLWDSDTYGDCFRAEGKLHHAQINKVAPALPCTSTPTALKALRSVLDAYEKKYWFEKLMFRWTEPHPIDVYYQLDEIAVLHAMNHEISEDGKTLSQDGMDIYRHSRLPNNIGWMDALTQGWRMLLNQAVVEKISKKEQREAGTQNVKQKIPQRTKIPLDETANAQLYENFRYASISRVSSAVKHAISEESAVEDSLNNIKLEISQTKQRIQASLNMARKNTYVASMNRWETFVHNCCDVLSEIPQDDIHIALQKKAGTLSTEWTDEIFNEAHAVKEKLSAVFSDTFKSLQERWNVWNSSKQTIASHMEIKCMALSSESLARPETTDAVLGLCYHLRVQKNHLHAHFSEDIETLKEERKKAHQVNVQERQERENTQKIVLHDATSDIAECIEKALNENLTPDEIPNLTEALAEALDKASNPDEQVALFSNILLWQNRYLEAASWNYTNNEDINVAKLATQYQQFANALYRKLALQLHPDKNPGNEEHMKTLGLQKTAHDDYTTDLLNTRFDGYRRQSAWLKKVGYAMRLNTPASMLEKLKSRLEKTEWDIEALRKRMEQDAQESQAAINKVEKAIEECEKAGDAQDEKLDALKKTADVAGKNLLVQSDQLKANGKTIENLQRMLKNLGTQWEEIRGSASQNQSIETTASSETRTSDYISNKPSKNYTPGFYAPETQAEDLNPEWPKQVTEETLFSLISTQ